MLDFFSPGKCGLNVQQLKKKLEFKLFVVCLQRKSVCLIPETVIFFFFGRRRVVENERNIIKKSEVYLTLAEVEYIINIIYIGFFYDSETGFICQLCIVDKKMFFLLVSANFM